MSKDVNVIHFLALNFNLTMPIDQREEQIEKYHSFGCALHGQRIIFCLIKKII